MSNEIIQNVTYDNYDDFQHANFIFSQDFISFHYFEDYLMMKLTLGKVSYTQKIMQFFENVAM